MRLFLQIPEILYASAQTKVLYVTLHKGMLYEVTVRKMDVDGTIENGMEHSRNTTFLVVSSSLE